MSSFNEEDMEQLNRLLTPPRARLVNYSFSDTEDMSMVSVISIVYLGFFFKTLIMTKISKFKFFDFFFKNSIFFLSE